MIIVDMAKKIQRTIMKRKHPLFVIDVEKQKSILNSIKEPSDLLERSYCQYLCQMMQLPLGLKIIQTIAAVLITPYYYLKYSINSNEKAENKKKTAVFISDTKDISYVPYSLKYEFDEIFLCDYNCLGILTSREKKVIKQIYKKYWFKPYFCLKIMMKIALYAYQANKYSPNAVLTFGEFSFTSSALTYYCNEIGMDHINIMHGEKLFNIRDSFVSFDRYYVWDQHYVDLLVKLRADKNQFRIEVPDVLRMDTKSSIEYKYELTYYLGGENEKDLYDIKASLLETKIHSEKICIRYHPRYSNENQINKVFNCFKIENPHDTSLEISLLITKYVVSLYSTILYQAYINNKNVVIDDMSNSQKYYKLESLDYIMIKKPHIRLSELCKQGNKKENYL